MRLYLSELKKLCAARLLVGLFFCLLFLNAILAALTARPSPAERAAREAYARYLTDPAATDAYYADLNRLAAENFRDETFTLPHTYTDDADDLLVLTLMYERVDYLAGHEEQMARMTKAAENRISDLRYYGYTEASYEIRRERQLMAHAERLRGAVSPTDPFAYGYDDYLSYPVTAILAALFITVAVAYIYLNDAACGFGSILRTTRGGRAETALAKLGATATVASASAVLLSLSAFAGVGMTVGYSSPMAAVHTLPLCSTVPFDLTVGGYLALRLLLLVLALLTYAGLIALAASLKLPYVGCLGVGALFWGGSYALFAHEYLGTPPAVRYLNLVALAEGNTLTDFYRSVSVLGYPVSHPTVLCAAAILLTLGLSALSVLFFVQDLRGISALHRRFRLRPSIRKTSGTRRGHRPSRVGLALVSYELKKLRFGWLCLAALVLFCAKGIYVYRAAGNMERYDEALYYDYITTVQSMDAPARVTYLTVERTRIDAIVADYPSKTAAYERGELSHEAFAAYVDTYYHARARSGVLRRVEDYVASIEAHDRLTGRESDILYTTGLEVFFGFSTDWFFFFAVLIFAVGVFAVEHRKTSSGGGSAPLIRSTPRGRGRTFAVKLGVGAVAGGVLAVSFRTVGLLIVARGYILPVPDATLSSVPGFASILSDMSIGEYLLLDLALQLPTGALFGALTVALSGICRRPPAILSAVLLCVALPELLMLTLFPQARGTSLLSLTAPQAAFCRSAEMQFLSCTGAWMLLVCLMHATLVTTLVLLARRSYNGHTYPRKGACHDPVVSKHP